MRATRNPFGKTRMGLAWHLNMTARKEERKWARDMAGARRQTVRLRSWSSTGIVDPPSVGVGGWGGG